MEFKLHAPYKPTGDQPRAIEKLVQGFEEGNQFETLVGVTGSGIYYGKHYPACTEAYSYNQS